MSNNIIEVEYIGQFGRKMFYPANDVAHKLAAFRKHKSFTKDEIDLLKDLGFQIKIRPKLAEIPDGIL